MRPCPPAHTADDSPRAQHSGRTRCPAARDHTPYRGHGLTLCTLAVLLLFTSQAMLAMLRDDDESQQLVGLSELCEYLSISTEEALITFPTETAVPLLVRQGWRPRTPGKPASLWRTACPPCGRPTGSRPLCLCRRQAVPRAWQGGLLYESAAARGALGSRQAGSRPGRQSPPARPPPPSPLAGAPAGL